MNTEEVSIHSELEACRIDGLIRPEDVIERAKRKKSPLHDKFTWDDGKAAHEYRLIEARNLIRVHVIHAVGDEDPVPVYVSLKQDRALPGGGYRAMADVLSDAQLYQQMLDDAFMQLSNLQQKYRRLRELEPVWSAAERAQTKGKMKKTA